MTKRQVFFSFHYRDSWRTGEIRNAGVIDGNPPVSDNEWEVVKNKGDENIKRWIDSNLNNRSCTVVLIGNETASRKWVKYEIQKSWELGKGLVGINIHNLKDENKHQDSKGKNPFESITVRQTLVTETQLSDIVKVYDPPFSISTNVFNHITENIAAWVEEAIAIRKTIPMGLIF